MCLDLIDLEWVHGCALQSTLNILHLHVMVHLLAILQDQVKTLISLVLMLLRVMVHYLWVQTCEDEVLGRTNPYERTLVSLQLLTDVQVSIYPGMCLPCVHVLGCLSSWERFQSI